MLAAAMLMLFTGLVVAQDKKFESKEGKFSAKFPGEPKTVNQKAGGLDLSITIVEKGKGGFAVIYSDMPADIVKGAPADKLLAGGEKGLVDNFKAKVTKSGEMKFKGNGKEYPGREILAEKDDLHLRVNIILVDNRLYQVFIVGPKEMVTGKEADEFIKSFELAK
jgi:hypothetical protein